MHMNDQRPVLVIGATGGQGGSVVRHAVRKGLAVRALVRDANALAAHALRAAGATFVTADFADQASLQRAMAGVRGVFSVQQDGAPPSHFEGVIAAAVAQRVEQFVHSTVSGVREWATRVTDDPDDPRRDYWQAKLAQERAVRAAPSRHRTYLRPSLILDNLMLRASYLYPRLASHGDLLIAMSPDHPIAFLTYDTIGRVAAEALANPDRFDDAEIELADAMISHRELAAMLMAASGKRVTVTSVPSDKAIAMGLPERVVQSHEWLERQGYPARPQMLSRYGLAALPIDEWMQGAIAHIGIGPIQKGVFQ